MDGLMAGAVAGVTTTLSMHPLDVAKIRLQVGRASSLHGALWELVRGGPRVAYRGLAPNVVGNGVAWGAYFWLYETLQRVGDHLGVVKGPYTTWGYAFLAGSLTQAATNPIWVLKTQVLATKRSDPSSPATATVALRRILASNGISGLWRGFVPGLFGTVQSAVYFSIYDSLKPWLQHKWHFSELASYFWASALAKSMAAIALYPHQVLRARLQDGTRRSTLAAVTRKIWQEQGIEGFYRGLSANLLRVVPAMTITLVTYEVVKGALKKDSKTKPTRNGQ